MSYLAVTKSRGHSYYKIMESYRDETGKVKHRVIFNIGTLSNLYQFLPKTIQNGNYKEKSSSAVNDHVPSIEIKSVHCCIHGTPYLLYRVSEWLGVSELMRLFFPNIEKEIDQPLSLILVAIYRVCELESKSKFADWFSHTSLPEYLNINPDLCTSQHILEQMEGITKENVEKFETTLHRKILAQFPDIKMTDPVFKPEFKKEEKKSIGLCNGGKQWHKQENIPMVSMAKSVLYEINEDKKEIVTDKYYGKHLMAPYHDDRETRQILTTCRDQTLIERLFEDFKDTDHFLVRIDLGIHVHAMIGYLGLALCCFVQYMLEDKYKYRNCSVTPLYPTLGA